MIAWRHPRPIGYEGRCIGSRSDLAVDRRKAKRLAQRIRARARRDGLPRAIACSPARRCRAVAVWLRRWGWRVQIDSGLREIDFGDWDGLRWDAIGIEAIDAWNADFLDHRPPGGESLADLLQRVAAWQPLPGFAGLIGHAGWLCARRWLAEQGAVLPSPASWPVSPRYGEAWRFSS
ncbi:MAG: histidine phosphatase family protein [Inhella sp.]